MRNKKISASLEDYLEAIYNLTNNSEVARSKDIANTLSVSRSSVTGALKLLKKKELVNYKPYGYITLTEQGKKTASQVAKKHDVIESFFINVLGIDSKTAQNAACRAEHALGNDVVSRLMCFVQYLDQNSANLAEEFKTYCNNKNNKAK